MVALGEAALPALAEAADTTDLELRLRIAALRDAIEYVLDHIPNAAPGDAIYVITDGEDNKGDDHSSHYHQQDLVRPG